MYTCQSNKHLTVLGNTQSTLSIQNLIYNTVVKHIGIP